MVFGLVFLGVHLNTKERSKHQGKEDQGWTLEMTIAYAKPYPHEVPADLFPYLHIQPCPDLLFLAFLENTKENHQKGKDFSSGVRKRVVSKRVVLADVPPERKPERGYVRQNHPFGNRPFISQ